jgi:hypothetical protein
MKKQDVGTNLRSHSLVYDCIHSMLLLLLLLPGQPQSAVC